MYIYQWFQKIWEYIGDSVNQIVAFSACFTALFAYLGLRIWRKELKGKSEYIKAKNLLKAVFKVKRAFAQVRNPAIFGFEFPNDEENEYKKTLFVYEKRWGVLVKAFEELEEHNLDARVEWGDEFEELIAPLINCRYELMLALSKFLRNKKGEKVKDIAGDFQKWIKEVDEVIYKTNDTDEFDVNLNDAINKYETKLRSYIK